MFLKIYARSTSSYTCKCTDTCATLSRWPQGEEDEAKEASASTVRYHLFRTFQFAASRFLQFACSLFYLSIDNHLGWPLPFTCLNLTLTASNLLLSFSSPRGGHLWLWLKCFIFTARSSALCMHTCKDDARRSSLREELHLMLCLCNFCL